MMFNEKTKWEEIIEHTDNIIKDIFDKKKMLTPDQYLWKIGRWVRNILVEKSQAYLASDHFQKEMFFGIDVELEHDDLYSIKLYKVIG